MKHKHTKARMKQCLALAECSTCCRVGGSSLKNFGALIVDPDRNVVIADGYNGGPRGGGELCGGESCLRDTMDIESGTHMEIGCHHAETNAICNAAASTNSTRGAVLFVTGEPCMMCAKLIHHAGIVGVYILQGVYTNINGVEYLRGNGIWVHQMDPETFEWVNTEPRSQV